MSVKIDIWFQDTLERVAMEIAKERAVKLYKDSYPGDVVVSVEPARTYDEVPWTPNERYRNNTFVLSIGLRNGDGDDLEVSLADVLKRVMGVAP